ncbi:MAG: hypothetical protein RL215_2829 [Planctomycetota bacterium]
MRVDVRPISLRGQSVLQFASRSATQEFHHNHSSTDALESFRQLISGRYRNVHLETPGEIVEGVYNPRTAFWKLHRRAQVAALPAPVPAHDRQPNYLIPPGTPCPFLHACGLMDQRGTVKASHSRKFRQINRFLEFVHDIADALPREGLLRVVDFGCGKSYLTFAVHHLLTVVLKRSCRITGLDRRSDVVDTCRRIAADLHMSDIDFQVGDIASFVCESPPDLVISLHACDTATDDALARAVGWSSAAILAVPCCQQELQRQLPGNPLPPLTSWGIARERFCALATDTQRAALLDASGYQTQLLEFIDLEHTPKNLLLRAIRVQARAADRALHEQRALRQAIEFRRTLHIPPLALERQLQGLGLLPEFPLSGTPAEAPP